MATLVVCSAGFFLVVAHGGGPQARLLHSPVATAAVVMAGIAMGSLGLVTLRVAGSDRTHAPDVVASGRRRTTLSTFFLLCAIGLVVQFVCVLVVLLVPGFSVTLGPGGPGLYVNLRTVTAFDLLVGLVVVCLYFIAVVRDARHTRDGV